MEFCFNGKLLKVDLSNRKTEVIPLPQDLVEKYLGGSALAIRLWGQYADLKADPLSPDNPLIFMTGLLTGTPVPCSCKFSVCAKSPVTGLVSESTAGGFFGQKLKASGFDGVIIIGSSSQPVYLELNNGSVGIRNADDLWGKDTFETTEILKARVNPKAEVAAIGQAGEKGSKIAAIIAGGHAARAAGRTGMGTVMAAKKLKAIVCYGDTRPAVNDPNRLIASIRGAMPQLKKGTEGLYKFGTAGGVVAVEASGDLPIKNWQQGSWKEGAAKTSGMYMADTILEGHYACYACPIRCGKDVRVDIGPYKGSISHGPEYETAAGFGAMCLNEDVNYIAAANDMCNRYGIDTISASSAIAFAMEAYEKGVITKDMADGLEINWGNGEVIIELLRRMCFKEGTIGNLLADGTKAAADKIGGIAPEFVVHVKGLELAYHDPRAFTSMAAAYGTGTRGACHLDGLTYFVESGAVKGYQFGFDKEFTVRGVENKAEIAKKMQDFLGLFNALGLCKFMIRGAVGAELLAEWVGSATGWQIGPTEILQIGERIFNLKRFYGMKLGISRKDDILPPRMLTHDRRTGGAAGSLPFQGRMLHEYYEMRGWTEEGLPTEEKLIELGLGELLS